MPKTDKVHVPDETSELCTLGVAAWQKRARMVVMAMEYLAERLAEKGKKPSEDLLKKAAAVRDDRGLMVSRLPEETEARLKAFIAQFNSEMGWSAGRIVRGITRKVHAMELAFDAIRSVNGSGVSAALTKIQMEYRGHKPGSYACTADEDIDACNRYIIINFDPLFNKLSLSAHYQEAPTQDEIDKKAKKVRKIETQQAQLKDTLSKMGPVATNKLSKYEEKAKATTETLELLLKIKAKLAEAVTRSVTWTALAEAVDRRIAFQEVKLKYFNLKAVTYSNSDSESDTDATASVEGDSSDEAASSSARSALLLGAVRTTPAVAHENVLAFAL